MVKVFDAGKTDSGNVDSKDQPPHCRMSFTVSLKLGYGNTVKFLIPAPNQIWIGLLLVGINLFIDTPNREKPDQGFQDQGISWISVS